MSQALQSERASKKAAPPERARQAPAETRPAIPDGPLPLQTLLYLQKFAGNAAVAEILEAAAPRKPQRPEDAAAPAAPGAPSTATAPAEPALLAVPQAAVGLASGAAGALGSLLGSLIAPAPAPANGKAKPGPEPAHPDLSGKADGKPAAGQTPDSAQSAGPATIEGGAGPAPTADTTTSAPPTPDTDPNFQAVKTRVHSSAGISKSHPPAHTKVAEAHAAAVGPPNQVASQAQAAQVEKMADQQPGAFDKAGFMAAVRKAIDASAPHTLEEADDFKDSGKAGQIQGQVSGLVGQNKQQAEGAIKGTTEAPPDTSNAQPKPVTPLPAEQPGAPPASVGAASAMPTPKSAEEVSLAKGPAEVNDSMAEAEVTEPQLKESNEPEFTGALAAKETAEKHSEEAPKAFRQEEQGVLDKAKASAGSSADQGLQQMHGQRGKALNAVAGGKGQAKTQDEARRAEVSSRIESIYGKTKEEVTGILNGIDPQVDSTFKAGEEKARAAFESYVDTRMTAYKDDRYSGLRGKYRWVRDKFAGLPSDVNQFYVQGRELYLTRMEAVISSVADIVGRELTRARDRIASGQLEIQKYVASLPADLKKVGEEAQQSIQARFDELTQAVDSKQDDLVNDLAKKYVESRDAVDSRIKEMKDANKGLIDRAKDAVMGVINTIRKLKDMLLGVLARVASVVGNIIAHPIAFLGNLVSGIKLGLTNFMSNIGEHLEKGLLGWLFGALGDAGLTLPEKFDLTGILSIIMQVLGLTYGHIRGLAVGIVGEEVVGHLEKSLEFFQVLIKEGPAGLWKWVVEKLSDLKETVMGKIKEFIQEKVIIAGIMWLIGLLNPVAAFIKACKAIYDIVMFFVDRATQVAELVNAIVDSVGAIAGGALGEAAGMVENALAKGIPVAIGFLASLLGLGGISDKIKTIIHAIQEPIHNIISKVLGVVLKPFKWIGNKIKQGAAWAKKKVQQGVAFVKTKAKQAGGWIKGKAQKLFGEGESEQSGAVKQKAHEILAERTARPFKNLAELQLVASQVENELRPEGLKSLTLEPRENGEVEVLAAASKKEKVATAKVEEVGEKAKLIKIECNVGMQSGKLIPRERLKQIEFEELSDLQDEIKVAKGGVLTNTELKGRSLEYSIQVQLGAPVEREGYEEKLETGSKVGLVGARKVFKDKQRTEVKDPHQRAHVIGAGFGLELPAVVYAPYEVNQQLQNRGIEGRLREATAKLYGTAPVFVEVTARTRPGTLNLGEIVYLVYVNSVTRENKVLEATIEVTGTTDKPRTTWDGQSYGGFVEGLTDMLTDTQAHLNDADPNIEDSEAEKQLRIKYKVTEKKLRAEIAAWKAGNND